MAGILLIVALMIIALVIRRLINGMKENLYQYRTIRQLGLLIFLGVFLVSETAYFFIDLKHGYPLSFYIMILDIKDSIGLFTVFLFPMTFFVSILVTISNLNLMRKEGRTLKNLLGLILGGFLCISTFFLEYGLSEQPYSSNLSAFLIDYLFYLYALFIAYLECILFGTVVIGIVAAKHIPRYDKDYIIILGCQIRKDGSLTPLLKSRVDKAMEFAVTQEKKTGKSLTFVVSGGKGADEVISEAEAMKNYLLASGIKDSQILVENRSQNTRENIRFSVNLIKQENADPQIAYSTTNYHVFRTGNIAFAQGIDIEGIGAKTKPYFWVNAFIREFIATLVSEWKNHLILFAAFALFLFFMQLYVY